MSSAPAVPSPSTQPSGSGLDALLPPEMARKAEEVGVRKAHIAPSSLFVLAVLAGAFISFGAIFSLTVGAGASVTKDAAGAVVSTASLPFGVNRLVSGVAFSLGLILVIVAGAELFTGNVLLIMAWASHRISTGAVVRNWAIVYTGNLVGSLGIVALAFAAGWYRNGGGAIGLLALSTAQGKVAHTSLEAFAGGILCNALVCLAVWLTYSARTTTDRILAIIPPIAAFVAAGFEHSIANMFFLPMAILVRMAAPAAFWTATGASADAYAALDLGSLIGNLVPVTLGNIVGGTLFVAAVYHFVYLRLGPDGTPNPSPFRRFGGG